MSTKRDRLVRLNSSLTHLMRRIRRVDEAQGIGRARLSTLAVLHFGGSCSLSDLAHSELVSRATMHHVVKGLEDEGMVTRSNDPLDGRRQVIALTKSGSETIVNAHQARIKYLTELTTGVSNDDLLTTVQTLEILRDNAAKATGAERS